MSQGLHRFVRRYLRARQIKTLKPAVKEFVDSLRANPHRLRGRAVTYMSSLIDGHQVIETRKPPQSIPAKIVRRRRNHSGNGRGGKAG